MTTHCVDSDADALDAAPLGQLQAPQVVPDLGPVQPGEAAADSRYQGTFYTPCYSVTCAQYQVGETPQGAQRCRAARNMQFADQHQPESLAHVGNAQCTQLIQEMLDAQRQPTLNMHRIEGGHGLVQQAAQEQGCKLPHSRVGAAQRCKVLGGGPTSLTFPSPWHSGQLSNTPSDWDEPAAPAAKPKQGSMAAGPMTEKGTCWPGGPKVPDAAQGMLEISCASPYRISPPASSTHQQHLLWDTQPAARQSQQVTPPPAAWSMQCAEAAAQGCSMEYAGAATQNFPGELKPAGQAPQQRCGPASYPSILQQSNATASAETGNRHVNQLHMCSSVPVVTQGKGLPASVSLPVLCAPAEDPLYTHFCQSMQAPARTLSRAPSSIRARKRMLKARGRHLMQAVFAVAAELQQLSKHGRA